MVKMKHIIALLLYLLIFAAIFGLAVFDYIHNMTIIEIGISTQIVNLMIIFLSALAILKTVWHIYSY